MREKLVHVVFMIILAIASHAICQSKSLAGEPSAPPNRGGWLDRRSLYGKGVFPEPFLVDDSDLEESELRLDWLHQQGKGASSDMAKLEFEKGFGLLTLELEAPYERDAARAFDRSRRRTITTRQEGFNNFSVGVRHPLWQFVSADERIDNTLGAAVEVGIPTNSPLSKNAEIVPKVFDDLRLGDHVTVQTVLGYSFLRGSKPSGGQEAFEYGVVVGYSIARDELPLPDVEQLIPVLELRGQTATNHGEAGHNTLRGNIAFRVNLKAIGGFQPRLGVGYVFPIDKGARDDLRWGVFSSLVFDF